MKCLTCLPHLVWQSCVFLEVESLSSVQTSWSCSAPHLYPCMSLLLGIHCSSTVSLMAWHYSSCTIELTDEENLKNTFQDGQSKLIVMPSVINGGNSPSATSQETAQILFMLCMQPDSLILLSNLLCLIWLCPAICNMSYVCEFIPRVLLMQVWDASCCYKVVQQIKDTANSAQHQRLHLSSDAFSSKTASL